MSQKFIKNSKRSEYNKTEKAKEISRKNAENMRNIKANMTEEEKRLSILKGIYKRSLLKYGKSHEKTIELKEKVMSKDPLYDPYDSPKDRMLNKQYPVIKLVNKTRIKLKEPIPVYDLTIKGDIPNFQLESQTYVHNCPGGGKSKGMAFLAKNAVAEMKNVIFITLELNETETMVNFKTAISGINMHDMLKPEYREEFTRKIQNFKNTFGGNLIVKFFKPATVNADTLQNYIRKVIQTKSEKLGITWKPDIIFVDYMDKLLPIQKVKGSSYEDMGNVANDLKNLAITFECPVVTGSQLGKYSWNLKGDDVISMDSIAESAAKVHIAHSMTTINFNPGEKTLGRARLFMAKSRSGRPGEIVWVENNLGRCLIKEIEQWDPKALEGEAGYTIRGVSSK